MKTENAKLIELLTAEVLKISAKSDVDIERFCWMVVHRHHHGIMPFEYDIREIDEDLFLAVLKRVKEELGD